MASSLTRAGLLASATTLASTAHQPLPGFLSTVQGPLDHYGIWAIGLLLLLENIGLPVIPGELAMIAGAIYAGSGQLNIVAVAVTSVIASFAGSAIGYLIGRLGGRALVTRYGKYVLIKPHHLDRAERAVDHYGWLIIIVARFIIGLRELSGIIAGTARMNPVSFLISSAVGAVAWVATWVSLGYLAGGHIAAIYADLTRYAIYVAIAAAVVVAAWIAVQLRRRRKRRADG
ncbi:MAG TPA: DedA family protein [Trebonia sp.]|nr:DedA family protein [Trebonia sp.]